ncbi:MAG: bifunctional phosphopantothenoylcysteine decarboxylase/phosphopantothenate--cysteine ligase CoaBC [Rhodothermaceae bacterium]|nr:bifunctional phosphopantothenoylcysteine decarboxylase/phosphopantothenate--cysteine ligase CoaBC [Rhodothermaceae bacterium]MXZ18015.1 bifunctional phosphopantothenoylcysteine decarboxylase/phosphopantothenate--cysteine ligase CoaBC [Rhodothermaceae bacterium]MYE62121.1 bifunctional phosphopantothenoylcysteine decarboxylase/phosphopantothenate--cysteine ligase CoaBC [Rhodothermaceae bacterium]MYG69340.1 bifunctional phosphopantothenoylcysteine decarboxylase/phosphopantothenate--cysteine liga
MSESSRITELHGKRLLLGVTGSIAAYKAAELIRRLRKLGTEVQVLATQGASQFISPTTLATLSGRSVLTDLFDGTEEDTWTKHITLGHWADLFVIAPATAQTLAKLANGFSDNMLTATALAARCPILICPAMDHDMYMHPSVRLNLKRLQGFGYHVLPPSYGELASGLVGLGRLPDADDILERIASLLPDELRGKHALVTAGPTREPIDPVRVLTNHSTGTMGFALAKDLVRRGAQVTLVTGPTLLNTPDGVRRIDITTSAEMLEAVLAHKDADFVFMAAAVADYAPDETLSSKIKKQEDQLTLRLHRTSDILAKLGKRRRNDQVLVGFAMETENGLANARKKLTDKNLDWIVLNNLTEEGAGFGPGTNRVTLIGKDGSSFPLEVMSKEEVATALLDRILTDCA